LNCRINAEEPSRDFAPSPGTITQFNLPGGPGIRVDTALYIGCEIPLFYDSLIVKVAAWGCSREEAILRMKNALQELSIRGVETTAAFLRRILMNEDYQRGCIHTSFIDEHLSSLKLSGEKDFEGVAVVSTVLINYLLNKQKAAAMIPSRSRKQLSLWKAAGRTGHFSGGSLRWIH
jgi:acetyl/propionyl-CoA carboxylase alpha subunit